MIMFQAATSCFGREPHTNLVYATSYPNALVRVLVLATVQGSIGDVLSEATCVVSEVVESFLRRPVISGTLIRDPQCEFFILGRSAWITIFPGVALILGVLSVTMLWGTGCATLLSPERLQ